MAFPGGSDGKDLPAMQETQVRSFTYLLMRGHDMIWEVHMFSVMSASVTSWTVAHQAPLSMKFSRQEYWSGLPFPTQGDLPDPGIKPAYLQSPALAGGFFYH